MRSLMLTALVLLALVLAGCGGGGGTTPAGGGSLTGQLNAPNAAEFNLIVDGQALDASPSADGSFTIPNLPPGRHYVTIVSNSGLVGAHLSVEVTDGDNTDVGDVTPVAGGQIVGIVSRMADGGALTPLAGVEVIADAEPIYIEGPVPVDSTRPQSRQANELSLRAITDGNGSYVLPAVPEGGYVVTVNVPGLMQGVAYVWVSPGTTSPADFQLLEAVEPGVATVKGTVRAETDGSSGAPLEGALVTVTSDGEWSPTPPGDVIALPASILAKGLLPKNATGIRMPPYQFNQFMTLTNADGRYTLHVPSGHLKLTVWAEGYEVAFDSMTAQPRDVLERDYTLPGYWYEYDEPAR